MSQVPERIVGHSPGPWHVDRDTSDDPETLILGVKDVLIGEAYETASPDDFHVAEANARLIAAAPELLAVLQALPLVATTIVGPAGERAEIHVPTTWLEQVNAAIVKATQP